MNMEELIRDNAWRSNSDIVIELLDAAEDADHAGRKGDAKFMRLAADRLENLSAALASHEPAPTDTQEGVSEAGEVVAFLVDCPAQPTLEFANVHVPDSAEPLVRQSALTACQQEVERLRERSEKFKWQVRDTCRRAEAAEARIAVLEKALEKIVEGKEVPDPLDDGRSTIMTDLGLDEIDQIARAALGGQSNE